MNDVKKRFLASAVISEIKQSDIFLTAKARLFETPGANLNGVRVTAQFIDDIINRKDEYVGLPLYADVKNLVNGNYEHLGHLYDPRTGEFHSVQIGSFYDFEAQQTEDGEALIGYARVPKRNKALSKAIGELFADGALKFSFEISCSVFSQLEDGTIQIDADVSNHLEGMAIVSFPACEDAVALDLVAEFNRIADENKDGEKDMHTEDVKEVVSEEATASENTAAVVTEQTTVTVEETNTFDTETCETTHDRTEHVVTTTTESAEVKHDEEIAAADPKEEQTEEDTPSEDEKPEQEQNAACKNKRAEQENAACKTGDEECAEDSEEESDEELAERVEAEKSEMDKKIAELESSILTLRAEIEVMKEEMKKPVVAETSQEDSAANPFISEIDANDKYSLLASAKEETSIHYSLLDRA